MYQAFLILIIPIFTAVAAQLFLKKGVAGLGNLDLSFSGLISLIPRILQNGWLVAGMFLFGISFLVYLFAISKLQLSIAYPVFVSAGIVLISLLSWFFLKETPSLFQILGITFIIFGIFLLAIKG